jgi:hypothetical protein
MANSPLASDPVQPIAWYMARTSHGPVKTPEYPEDTVAAGDRVRELRLDVGLNLRPAAAAVGLLAVELSAIEFGRVRLRAPALAVSYLERIWRGKEGTPTK